MVMLVLLSVPVPWFMSHVLVKMLAFFVFVLGAVEGCFTGPVNTKVTQ